MLRADLRGPLGGPLGESEDRKDVRTGSVNWQRNNLALEKGRIKQSDQYDERDQEIEQLRKLVRDFELEGRNRRQRQNQDNRERRDDNVGGRNDEEPKQTSSHQRRDHS